MFEEEEEEEIGTQFRLIVFRDVGFLQKEFSVMDMLAGIWECLKGGFSFQHVNLTFCSPREKCKFNFYSFLNILLMEDAYGDLFKLLFSSL